MELLTSKLRFVTVLSTYYFQISLVVFFAHKNVLCELLLFHLRTTRK